MTPLGVKICEESEFDIFEAKNASLIQGRPVYLSTKSQKCDHFKAPHFQEFVLISKKVIFEEKYKKMKLKLYL